MILDTTLRVRIPRQLRARLSRVAERTYKTEAEVSREALRAYVHRHDPQPDDPAPRKSTRRSI